MGVVLIGVGNSSQRIEFIDSSSEVMCNTMSVFWAVQIREEDWGIQGLRALRPVSYNSKVVVITLSRQYGCSTLACVHLFTMTSVGVSSPESFIKVVRWSPRFLG